MKVLIPLVSKKENNPAFLQQVPEQAREIVLLLVIDQKEMFGKFGFATSEIMQGTALMGEIKKTLEEKGKRVNDITEWGDTETKIEHIALLQRVDKIFLLEQQNEYFNSLLKHLKKELEKKIEIVKPAQETQKKENNFGIGKT